MKNARGYLLVLYFTCAACAPDPKAPSEANFRAAINEAFKKKNPYCGILEHMVKDGEQRNRFLDALVREGLIEKTVSRTLLGPLNHYRPTEKSKEVLSMAPNLSGFPAFPSGCVAEAKVVAITNWTEPGNMFGTIVTEVSYTYRPTQLSPWVTKDLKTFVQHFLVEKEDKAALQLTAKGWQKVNPWEWK